MLPEDLKVFSEMGRALWIEPATADSVTMETLGAVSSLESASLPTATQNSAMMTETRMLERAARALLQRAMAEEKTRLIPPGAPRFFQLGAQQRFALVALHLGDWTYARLSRVMNLTPEQVQDVVWYARFSLAEKRIPPVVNLPSHQCPEYDFSRPWMQAFLDEELESKQEQLFLQNHLMSCETCTRLVNQTRDLMADVDQEIPAMDVSEDSLSALHELDHFSRGFRAPADMSTGELIGTFFRRPEVIIAMAFLIYGFLRLARAVSIAHY